MKLLERPLGRGQRCAITERTQDPRGFIHTNRVLSGWDQELIVSHAAAMELGRLAGMYPPEQVDALKADLAGYAARVEELEDYAKKLDSYISSQRDLEEAVA